jgi:uncharacterized protein YndB with AHSA1/START domain
MENIEQIQYIKAPIAKVYEALTTEKGLAEVWTKNLRVKPELGFVNEFDFKDNYATKIVALEENRRIEWECIATDPEWVGTTVSFELEEKNGVTCVWFGHRKWRALTEFYRMCNYNWAMFLYSLKSYCEDGKGMSFQDRKF